MFIVAICQVSLSSVRSDIYHISLLTELRKRDYS